MIDCDEGLKPSVPFELHLLLSNLIYSEVRARTERFVGDLLGARSVQARMYLYLSGSVAEAVKRVVLFPTGPLRTPSSTDLPARSL
jgi:hypothetical protein